MVLRSSPDRKPLGLAPAADRELGLEFDAIFFPHSATIQRTWSLPDSVSCFFVNGISLDSVVA